MLIQSFIMIALIVAPSPVAAFMAATDFSRTGERSPEAVEARLRQVKKARIVTADRIFEIRQVDFTPGLVRFRTGSGYVDSVAWSAIQRIEVPVHSAGRGAALGGLGGVAAALTLFEAASPDPSPFAIAISIPLVLAGTLVGTIVGSRITRWKPIYEAP